MSNVPLEWVFVPSEATPEMLEAAGHACDGMNLSKMTRIEKSRFKAAARWKAMLAAAPRSATSGNIDATVAHVKSSPINAGGFVDPMRIDD